MRAWKPRLPGVREVLHARFREHAYPMHTHEDWTVFIVDEGAIEYDLDRHEHLAPSQLVSILPPGVVHDGRPGSSGGYRKRVLYVDTTVLPESLIGPAVDRPAIPDATLRAQVAALHDALACPDDEFEAETRLELIAERIRASLGAPEPPSRATTDRLAAEALRDYLDARLFEPLTLADAARHIGWSPAHAARAFATVFGIPPHAYVVGRRLDAARDRILSGQPLSEVASEVGFFDQAHLTRRFRRFLGTTPSRFAHAG